MAPVTQAWSYSAGEKGRNRVRVAARASGILVLEFQDEGRKVRQSLHHRDQDQAKRQADELAAALTRPARDGRCTLQALFDSYLREVTPTRTPKRQAEHQRWARWILTGVGAHRQVASLTHRDVRRYVALRQQLGDQRTAEGSHGKAIGARGLRQQLQFWRQVTTWGIGEGLCAVNPLEGFTPPAGPAPFRPRISEAGYQARLAIADEIGPGPAPTRFHVMLVLAHETGHRRGAISRLRANDLDLDGGRVRWRGARDKIGLDHVTPLSPTAVALLRARMAAAPVIGEGWLFPSLRRPGQPLEPTAFVRWWREATEKAGLPQVPGEGYHGFRRKFATDLKGVPLKDLADLGGWKSPQTIVTCYMQSDEATMRQALERRVAIT